MEPHSQELFKISCENNPIAKRLYESRGFAATGVKDEDEIELVMTIEK